jgi:branched-chain amino acid transport system permease protein
MGTLSDALAPVPLLSALTHPDRWLLWLGILFVASIYAFPGGIVGRLRGS